MSTELINLILFISYVVILLSFGVFAGWFTFQKRKNADAMRKNVLKKIEGGIDLSARDIVNIGKSFDLSPYQARKVIYKIFSNVDKKEDFAKLNTLVQEIETEEPFDDLPDEVKPSLARLTKITDDSEEESDKFILSPILTTLSKYVELRTEQQKLKKQTNRAYILTIVSFVFGAISFYFTLTAPTAGDIAEQINALNAIETSQTDKK
ncbi:hypothetical protein AB8302_004605 [Vibrio parahaemolyticus]|nr:hypothetical protein [Vibrio parahaemolyticus]EGR2205753.1 hypothetical protein [Vibrio parahaemolyticus]EHH1251604.1 hypothetical protein [Vibrio parahaemolyticus]EHU5134561.1 hypothetical protein [Vibrio parahaemolyticus]EHW0633263.1 hypothetical protein [Vibrio parahaemolyticus]